MIKVPESTIKWLIESEIPRVSFGARKIFLNDEDRSLLYQDPLIRKLITSLGDWKKEVLKQHNKPDLAMQRLCLLADSGVKACDPEMRVVTDMVQGSFEEDALPRISILIPKAFRGSGEIEREWIICDYPQILYSLLKMGAVNPLLTRSVEYLATLSRENGYPCVSSMETFRGPGNKSDFCPIASLYALKALNLHPELRKSEAAARAAESLLSHWEDRTGKKHFLFGIGTDFKKLKYPMIWYNIIHVLDVLSRSDFGIEDPRTGEMAEIILTKAGGDFHFVPESMYMYYKGEDFADKKTPSPTLTLAVLKILMRLGMVEI